MIVEVGGESRGGPRIRGHGGTTTETWRPSFRIRGAALATFCENRATPQELGVHQNLVRICLAALRGDSPGFRKKGDLWTVVSFHKNGRPGGALDIYTLNWWCFRGCPLDHLWGSEKYRFWGSLWGGLPGAQEWPGSPQSKKRLPRTPRKQGSGPARLLQKKTSQLLSFER